MLLHLAAGCECSMLLLILCVMESDTMVMGMAMKSVMGGWFLFRPAKLAHPPTSPPQVMALDNHFCSMIGR